MQPSAVNSASASGTEDTGRRPRRESERLGAVGGRGKKSTAAVTQPTGPSGKPTTEVQSPQPADNPEPCSSVTSESESNTKPGVTEPATELQTTQD